MRVLLIIVAVIVVLWLLSIALRRQS